MDRHPDLEYTSIIRLEADEFPPREKTIAVKNLRCFGARLMDTGNFLNLRKFLSPEIVYGEGSLELAGRHACNMGASKVLVVSDPGVEDSGWMSRVEASLREADLAHTTFTDVSANPKD